MDSQENQIVENQLHRSVLLDHEMVVDGVVLRERKELNNVADDEGNQQKSVLIHTRFIGDKKYEVQLVAVGNDVVRVNVDTNLPDEDISKFNEEWEEKWIRGEEEIKHHFPHFPEFASGMMEWNDKWDRALRDHPALTTFHFGNFGVFLNPYL